MQKSFKNLPKKYRKAFKNAFFFRASRENAEKIVLKNFPRRFAPKMQKKSALKKFSPLRGENVEKSASKWAALRAEKFRKKIRKAFKKCLKIAEKL